MSSKDDMLSAYVTSYSSRIPLNILLTACDYSISGGEEITKKEAHDIYMAEIDPTYTRLYQDMDVWGAGEATLDFELPTAHFKEIVLTWRDFVE